MKQKKQAFAFLGLLAGILLFCVTIAGSAYKPRRLNVEGNWEKTVVEIDGQGYTLKDLAWYIAYEEHTVEEQARVYDPSDTNAYWNLHTNGEFVKIAARDAAMDMAIHDMIFYQLSVKNQIALTDEEKQKLELKQYDFWSDLEEEQRQVLDPFKEQVLSTMEQIALAQKQQEVTAELNGDSYENYLQDGEAYKRMLQAHSYKVYKDVWERLEFGNLTISHAAE